SSHCYLPFHTHIHSLPFFPFFFHATATPEIYTLSLHDALPISRCSAGPPAGCRITGCAAISPTASRSWRRAPELSPRPQVCTSRSEEHTSELQSRENLVCRLLLEKKKKKKQKNITTKESKMEKR